MCLSISSYEPDNCDGTPSNSVAIHLIEKLLKDCKKVDKGAREKPNHLIVETWSWPSIFITIRVLETIRTIAHVHFQTSLEGVKERSKKQFRLFYKNDILRQIYADHNFRFIRLK